MTGFLTSVKLPPLKSNTFLLLCPENVWLKDLLKRDLALMGWREVEAYREHWPMFAGNANQT